MPKHKQEELKEITSITKANPGVEMVILFGSYARGDWVEDVYTEGHITYEYKSDFDILVIVKNRQYARRIMTWDNMESAIHNSRTIKTWATVIVHDIKEVNRALSSGRYFFTDVKKEGVLLYDSKRFKLEKAQKLTPEERKQIAQEDFKYWFKSANEFLIDFGHAFKRRSYSKAAFELHQATERFYTTILLVFTHYKPKEHDIRTLGKQAGNLDPRFLPIFPRKTPEERRLFELLRKAYTEARYNRNYKITKKELEYLAARVKKLQQLTKEVCKEKIESYG
ncbi:MAG TPA: HEPN domain-containing protein [Blastocatellia bacterium]|nr:HEPN domain-containing protein [Blastocatellia bacterium]